MQKNAIQKCIWPEGKRLPAIHPIRAPGPTLHQALVLFTAGLEDLTRKVLWPRNGIGRDASEGETSTYIYIYMG